MFSDMKMPFVLVALILLTSLSASLITINKASSIAQAKMHSAVPPTSNPGVPSIVDNTTYYIMEFGDSWIPVNAESGQVVQNYTDSAYQAVYLHQFAQLVSLGRKNDAYPTNLVNNLVSLQGNVESKIVYYNTYIPQLPDQLKPLAISALKQMKDLDGAIKKTLSDIDKLKKIEDYIFTVSISQVNETMWRSTFSGVLSDIGDIVMKGYAFEDARNKFVSSAAEYVQNDSNDIQKRSLVANFISDCGIDGIPSTLPNYKNVVSNWNNWLETVLSKNSIGTKAKQKFASALDNFNQIRAKNMKIEAYNKVSVVKAGFENIKSEIGWCIDQLPYRYQQMYKEAEDYYNKSLSSYNEGSVLLNQSNYTLALMKFEDAMGWADRLAPLVTDLSDAKCPGPKPVQSSTGIIQILQKNWIAIVSFLVILLGVIYFFQSRPGKGRKQLEEYYSGDEGYSSDDLFDDQGPTDISDLFKQ